MPASRDQKTKRPLIVDIVLALLIAVVAIGLMIGSLLLWFAILG